MFYCMFYFTCDRSFIDVSIRGGSIEAAAAGGLAFWLTGFGRQLRVLVIGSHDVGKSVIIRRLIGQGLVSDGPELSESASCNSLRGLSAAIR